MCGGLGEADVEETSEECDEAREVEGNGKHELVRLSL